MIDHGFIASEVGDAFCTRGYSVSFHLYGRGVLHHDHPAIEIAWGDKNPTVVLADSYEDLIDILDRLRERVVERQATDDPASD